jgi:hypothetical protein
MAGHTRQFMLGLFCLALLGGCGGEAPEHKLSQSAQPLQNLFPLIDGATWIFQNINTGDFTQIEWHKVDYGFGCEENAGKLYLSIWTKSNPRTYWAPGFDTSLYMFWENDGTMVRSPGWYGTTTDGHFGMFDFIQTGSEHPYPIMFDTFLGHTSIEAPYVLRLASATRPMLDCVPASSGDQSIPWTTEFYQDTISTPFYSGPVVISHQMEGTPGGPWNHEYWAFAPNLGIVQIKEVQTGDTIFDPPLTINRIR